MLVSELNFGAQSRWSAAGSVLPTRDPDGPVPMATTPEYCLANSADPRCDPGA